MLTFIFSVYGDSDVTTNPDDLLPPIAKLEKYAESDNIFNRSALSSVLVPRARNLILAPANFSYFASVR